MTWSEWSSAMRGEARLCQHDHVVREWPGRAHVETLRCWPELAQTVARIESQPDVFVGAILLGSLARGEGDAISDVDLVAVTRPGGWEHAWATRDVLSAGALVTFDHFEQGRPEVAGHSWITPSLVKVECLITAPGRMRLRGHTFVLFGKEDVLDLFEKAEPHSRQQLEDYAANLRETNAISEIERAYGDLIALLRREVRDRTSNPDTDHGR
jgi:hypothetical protein